MSKLITVTAGDRSFLVEADDSIQIPEDWRRMVEIKAGIAPGFKGTVDLGKIVPDFAQVKDAILSYIENVVAAFERTHPNIKTVCVEFGITLASEGGVPFLAKASGEATMKVSVEWHRP